MKYNPQITLTQKGAGVNLDTFDVQTEVRDKARAYWDEHSAKNKPKGKPTPTMDADEGENEGTGLTEDELMEKVVKKLNG